MLLINAAHQSGGRREYLIYEDEDRLLRRELYTLADDIDKLANSEIRRDEIFLLIDRSDV